jgi:hypothetical protein
MIATLWMGIYKRAGIAAMLRESSCWRAVSWLATGRLSTQHDIAYAAQCQR